MKGKKTIILGIMMMICALVVQPVSAYAAPDLTHDVTLTVHFSPDGKPAEGAEFNIYKVADMDKDVNFTLCGKFAKYNDVIEFNKDTYPTLGETLKGLVESDRIEATNSGKLDEFGNITFATEGDKKFEPGMYLVIGKKYTRDNVNYYCQAALISVPNLKSNGEWEYNAYVNPKYSKEEFTKETTKVKIIKIWTNMNPRRSLTIEMELLCDGVHYGYYELNYDNNWQVEIQDLEAGHEWSVVEKTISADWRVTVEKNAYIFQVENKPPVPETPEDPTEDPPEDPNEPGDTPPTPKTPEIPFTSIIWWPVPLFLTLGFALLVLGGFVRSKESSR